MTHKDRSRVELKNPATGYNERLFESRGLRSYFHSSRFHWFKKICSSRQINSRSLFELGCFDGRLLRYLPFELDRYLGYDADWEGGLSAARKVYADQPRFQFQKSENPRDLEAIPDSSFDLCVAMETLEHLPPHLVDSYLAEIARICSDCFVVSVPNEKGVIFFLKYFTKRFIFRDAQNYSISEVFNASVGRLKKVERDDHKGFDYSELLGQMEKYFEIDTVQPVPFAWLPRSFGFTIGIVAKKKE